MEGTASCVLIDGSWYFTLPVDTEAVPIAKDVTESDVEYLYEFRSPDNNKYGLLNQSAKVIIEPFFERVEILESEYIPVKKDGNWGIIDRKGNLVLDYQFQSIGLSKAKSDGAEYFKVQHNNMWGVFGPRTSTYIPCSYDEIGYIDNGIFPVQRNGWWGAVDGNGKQVISFKYRELGRFNDGVIPAKLDGFWGVIDKNENVKAQFMYDEISGGDEWGTAFKNGKIGVEYNYNLGIIDVNGEYVVPLGELGSHRVASIEDEYLVTRGTAYYGPLKKVYFFASKQFMELPEQIAEIVFRGEQSSYYTFVKELGGIFYYRVYPYFRISDGKYFMIGMDANGNLITNLRDIVMSTLSASHPAVRNETLLENIMVVHAFLDHGERYNIVGPNGTLLLDNWVEIEPSAYDGVIWVYDDVANETIVFSDAGEMLASVEGYYNYLDVYGGLIRFTNDEIQYANYLTGEKKTMSVRSEKRIAAGPNEQCAILYDGIHYGLFSGTGEGEMVGSGMNYRSVDYDAQADLFTLSLGAEKEYYRIGRDGTIVKLG